MKKKLLPIIIALALTMSCSVAYAQGNLIDHSEGLDALVINDTPLAVPVETINGDAADEFPESEAIEEEEPLYKVEAVKGVEAIPASLLKDVDEMGVMNLFIATITNSDGTETRLTQVNPTDGLNIWMAYESADETDKEGNITRTYTIGFYAKDPAEMIAAQKAAAEIEDLEEAAAALAAIEVIEPLETQELKMVFESDPQEKAPVRSKFTFNVTKTKNWTLFRLTPAVDGTYCLSQEENSRISMLFVSGEEKQAYSLSDTFSLEGGKEYTVLVTYELPEPEPSPAEAEPLAAEEPEVEPTDDKTPDSGTKSAQD